MTDRKQEKREMQSRNKCINSKETGERSPFRNTGGYDGRDADRRRQNE
jgi:hypothetical protein